MRKKTFAIVISLIAVLTIVVFSGNVYPLGHFNHSPQFTTIGGSVTDCSICHDFANGYYESPPSGYNLRWVRRQIEYPTGTFHDVTFTTFSGTSGTLADGSPPYDGPCEVCHTTTDYHRNNSTGDHTHYVGQDCTVCHLHFLDDITDYFEPHFTGTQSHFTHWDDPKGPRLGNTTCFYDQQPGGCHNRGSFKKFGPDPGQYLKDTTVCNNCHSGGGAYDGVGTLGTCSITTANVCNEDSDCPTGETCVSDPNSVAFGAKFNWEDGIYEPPADPNAWPSRLRAGKENWCAGCHDNGISVVNGIHAPNVMGDNINYGYNINGHGRNSNNYVGCLSPLPLGCHNALAIHIDSNARTYEVSGYSIPPVVVHPYKESYRLADDMDIPRYLQYGSDAFKLCFNCHSYTEIFGAKSKFRNVTSEENVNLHDVHAGEAYRAWISWDSDWDGVNCNNPSHPPQCVDSVISCPACHNVHGSPCLIGPLGSVSAIASCSDPLKAPMIRHGELISTSTEDRRPALDFRWYESDATTQTTNFLESHYGGMRCGNPYNASVNHVCWGCHPLSASLQYHRRIEEVIVYRVWTTDLADNEIDTFRPGDPIGYHVEFTLIGANRPYYVGARAVVKNVTPGAKDWGETVEKFVTTSPGEHYHWKGYRTVSNDADSGSDAEVTIHVGVFDTSGAPLINRDNKYKIFHIQ
jgi:hypothetical protein